MAVAADSAVARPRGARAGPQLRPRAAAHTFVDDFETPVSAFLKLRDGGPAFLLESAEHHGVVTFAGHVVGLQPEETGTFFIVARAGHVVKFAQRKARADRGDVDAIGRVFGASASEKRIRNDFDAP